VCSTGRPQRGSRFVSSTRARCASQVSREGYGSLTWKAPVARTQTKNQIMRLTAVFVPVGDETPNQGLWAHERRTARQDVKVIDTEKWEERRPCRLPNRLLSVCRRPRFLK